MTKPAETFSTLEAVGNREDLTDDFKMVEPTQTPLYSRIGSRKAKSTFHEWQTSALRPPRLDNAKNEGADAVKTNAYNSVRLGNRVQRFEEYASVSGTQEAVDRAGVASDFEEQKTKSMLDMRRDIELTLLSKRGSNKENEDSSGTADSGAPQRMGGIRCFVETNVSRGATGTSGGFSNGNWQPPGAGTSRALTEQLVKDVMISRFEVAGTQSDRLVALMSAGNKEAFAGFAGLSQTRDPLSDGKRVVSSAVDIYYTNYGVLEAVPHPYGFDAGQGQNGDVIIIDPAYVKRAVLRRPTSKRLAETGDRREEMMTCEETLVVLNERALGGIADLAA
ncbi:MAG: DUF5309 family protein [Pseudomonadota bacterium]